MQLLVVPLCCCADWMLIRMLVQITRSQSLEPKWLPTSVCTTATSLTSNVGKTGGKAPKEKGGPRAHRTRQAPGENSATPTQGGKNEVKPQRLLACNTCFCTQVVVGLTQLQETHLENADYVRCLLGGGGVLVPENFQN